MKLKGTKSKKWQWGSFYANFWKAMRKLFLWLNQDQNPLAKWRSVWRCCTITSMENDLLRQSALCSLPVRHSNIFLSIVRWKESDSKSVSGNIYEKWPSIRTLSHFCFCPGRRRSNQASGAWPREALNRGEERRNEQLQSVLQRRFQRVKQMFNQCCYRFQGSLRDKCGWKQLANRKDEWLDRTSQREE